MNAVVIVTLLDALLMLSARAPALVLRFRAIRDELAQMQAEGRDPTPEEWEAVGSSIDARLARLRAGSSQVHAS